MRKVSGVVFLAGFIAFCVCGVSLAGERITLVGDDNYPPYTYLEDGKAAGIYVRILERVLPLVEGYDVTLKLKPWRRALEEAEKGEAFGVFPPYFRPELRPWMTRYSDPIVLEEVIIVCNREAASRVRWPFPQGYRGMMFGNNLGFAAGGTSFMSTVRSGDIFLDEAGGTYTNLKKIVLKRIDCYINDRRAIYWAFKNLALSEPPEGLAERWRLNLNRENVVEMQVLQVDAGHIGFSSEVDAADFIRKFNAALAEVRQRGDVERIIKEYEQAVGIE